MGLELADIKFFKSMMVTDTDENGGRMDEAKEIVDNVKYNLFPRVTYQERINGYTRYRKMFIANRNADDEVAYGVLYCILKPSNGGDRFYIRKGSQTDIQADIVGATDWTGGGKLNADVAAGATQIEVLFENNDFNIPDGATLCISDDTNLCWVKTASSNCASWSGNVVTISLAEQVPYDFSATNTYVGVCLDIGDLKPSLTDKNVNSANGTFDETKVTLKNKGAVYDEWTITFQDATNFTCSGTNEGSQPNGNINSEYSPINPRTGQPFFIIPLDAWSGSWQAGDTVTFKTYPAAAAVWWKEVIPAGTAREPNNVVTAEIFVE